MTESNEYQPTIQRFTGFASGYDSYRPGTPPCIIDTLCALAKTDRPGCVVDLGAGTGLSTRPWSDVADKVVGVEPSRDMLEEARRQTSQSNVEYQEGFGHATGLSDQCADIVTCSSSIHWMEPEATLAEAKRILRPRGVFCYYGYRYPMPIGAWEVEKAYRSFRIALDQKEKAARQSEEKTPRWGWEEFYRRMNEGDDFTYANKLFLHTSLSWNADDFLGWVQIHGAVKMLMEKGFSEEDIGLDHLRTVIKRHMGETKEPVLLGYTVYVGIS
jgi:ubiquinone/menaquinone biosynthesis C-methylase UbiE